jgi:phage protein D
VALLPSSIRYPRLAVLANGTPVAGAIEAQVYSNNHYAADRFSVTVALNADPSSAAFWSGTPDILLDVRMSLDGIGFTSVVQGAVDLVDLDLVQGVIRAEGRDLTATLIESRTQETFANRTASEIAQLFAGRHNLASEVAETRTPVGRYYQDEHDRITLGQFSRATTEWDLLVFLAQQEGFDVFVSGSTLYFQPPAGADVALTLSPDTVLDLRLERSLTLARDIEVTVKSWNSRQQNAFTQTARSRGHGQGAGLGGGRSGPPQRYVIVRPNLTSDQALQLAQQKLAELTRHERVISATMPGELTLTPRSLITLQGTGTDFDQTYYVDTIERHLHMEGGFTQHLRCKNMNPGTQATPPADIVASVTG